MKAVIRPRAQEDIIRQFRWYLVEQDAPEAAFRFVEAVEASVEQLLRMPNMGAPRELRNPALKGLRLWPVKEFAEFLIGGYPLDSGSPYSLWFGLGGRMNDPIIRDGVHCDGLLREAEEKLASAF